MTNWPATSKLDENEVSGLSNRQRERMDSYIARSMAYLTDPNKTKRIESRMCKVCFYSGPKLAGQAFTEWNCRCCLEIQDKWPNTSHPAVCDECSKKYSLCPECGADTHLRVRRNNTAKIPDGAL